MSTAPKSKILDITRMVEFQTGAVVSRQITKAESGNVTLFAFDENQELSEHTAPFDALVQLLDGEAEIRNGERILRPKNSASSETGTGL